MENLIVKYENVKFKDNFHFAESERLQEIYKNFKAIINKHHNSKHEICFYLNQLKEFFDRYSNGNNDIHIVCDYSRAGGLNGYYSFIEFCQRFFNFEKSTVYKYLQVYDKFLKDMSSPYYEKFREFDVSKLAELLPVDYDALCHDIDECVVTPLKSFKDIRKYVKSKSLGAETNVDNSADEINEEEIPDAYDPSQHYEDKYFMGLAKSQLVNNIISLQNYCERLQAQLDKLKKKKAV